MIALAIFTILWLMHLPNVSATGDKYLIGSGRYDITGPSVEIEMMGYASLDQIGTGIHFRQYSRAFIVADEANQNRVVFICADIGMASQIVKIEVVKKLQSLYGDTYTESNVLITGTHTHSGPAGFLQYVLYEITSLGFVEQAFDAYVDGIVESVKIAHDNIKLGHLFINTGELLDANINRSPTAYLNNPEDERALYIYDTDKEMTVLKMVDENGDGIGMIDWYAVHCTSMNKTNTLISGDNKGYAAYLMEQHMNKGELPGYGDFVAAFAQSNEGDVSPNTEGPHCIDTGLPCDTATSTCNGNNQLCVAFGPGSDMFDSTRIIGEKQFSMGKDLYENADVGLEGIVDSVHTNVDFSSVSVTVNGEQVSTCAPAMGFSFAAGTTDGQGAFSFEQGDTSGSTFWALIRNIISAPSEDDINCHHPKPILLNTGDLNFPYAWQPRILPLQILRIGQLVIVGVPAEFSTMSGRRLIKTVKEVLLDNGFPSNIKVVITGLSNAYSSYVTTFEEYQIQRYEGASTVYGPYTLDAYLQEFGTLAAALAKGEGAGVDQGPTPPNLLDEQWSLITPVIYDGVPWFKDFGDVITDVSKGTYTVDETVEVEFWAGNPRNNLMTGGTFLTVEKQENSQWKVVHTDASWETKFSWRRTSTILGQSIVTVTWNIPDYVEPGNYRIRHYGYYKRFSFFSGGSTEPYVGTSSVFSVTKE